MVYSFRLVGTGDPPFYRDFEIREDQTFHEFHSVIQEELGYDKSQIASFFLAGENWERGLEINPLDMMDGSFTPVIGMDIQVRELMVGKNRRLLYVFDFFSDRAFYLELVSLAAHDNNKTYPCCISGEGSPPEQTIIPGYL
jgi:hypothetical protein